VSQVVRKALVEAWPSLFRYATRLTGEFDAGRDLLQQCAANALAASRQPINAQAARVWLFKILRNAWIDQYRHDRASPIDGDLNTVDIIESGCFDDRLINEITVRQALARIDPAYRDVITLIDVEGFKYAEAAQILNVPIGTVMSRLNRGRLAILADIEGSNVRPFDNRSRRTS